MFPVWVKLLIPVHIYIYTLKCKKKKCVKNRDLLKNKRSTDIVMLARDLNAQVESLDKKDWFWVQYLNES